MLTLPLTRIRTPEVTWHIAIRHGKRKALNKDNEAEASIDRAEKLESGIRAKVEVRYRGLNNSIAQG